MRRSVRVHADVGPEARLADAIGHLPPSAKRALVAIADREDLPLVAGTWGDDHGGCLVSNVVAAMGVPVEDAGRTVDLRVLDLFPEMSSRDLNLLVVAWDEAAMQEGRPTDPALRRLLRGALVRAGVPPTLAAFDLQDSDLLFPDRGAAARATGAATGDAGPDRADAVAGPPAPRLR